MSEQPGFLTKYWRGEIALPISFWLVNFTASITLGVILSVLFRVLEADGGYRPLVIFIGVVAGWAIAIVIQVWQYVGLWRSAGTYLSQHHGVRRLAAYLARLMVGAGLVANIPILTTQGFPQFVEVFKIAFADDPDIPDYEIRLSEDRQEIHVSGGFKYGLAKDLRRAAEAAPTARIVVFESEGGRIGEAEAVFDLLMEKQLSTAVNVECASACALAFMGGKNRWLGVTGKIGLHSAHFVGLNAYQIADATRKFENRITQLSGVPTLFFNKARQFDKDDMWYPTRNELLRNNILTARFSMAPSSMQAFNEMAREVEVMMRDSLPHQVNSEITLVQFDVLKNNFIYTMIVDPSQISRADFRSGAADLKRELRHGLCDQEEVRAMMEVGVVYYHLFFYGNQDGEALTFHNAECD